MCNSQKCLRQPFALTLSIDPHQQKQYWKSTSSSSLRHIALIRQLQLLEIAGISSCRDVSVLEIVLVDRVAKNSIRFGRFSNSFLGKMNAFCYHKFHRMYQERERGNHRLIVMLANDALFLSIVVGCIKTRYQ